MAARIARTALVALALVAGSVGCSRFQEAIAPTKAEYIAVADQVCKDAEKAIDEVEVEAIEEPDPNRTERWIRADLVPAYRGMSGSLRGIMPPAGDEVYLSSLYNDLDHTITLLHASPSKGRALVRDDEDLRSRFSSYGMKVCGRV